jgi:hypothetical protein
MSGSWGSHSWDWGHGGQWGTHWWSANDSNDWQAASWSTSQETPSSQTAATKNAAARALRRMTTDDGKEYVNRTYLGGEERTSLTREDRLKLAWAVIYSLEPEVEYMWQPQWIQRADLQLATGAQLDALIYLTSRFQPATNLRTFKDLRPQTVREGVRASYVSRHPTVDDRVKLMEEISQHRGHLDVLIRWAEYNYFLPGADPKAPMLTSIKARAPRGQDVGSAGERVGWLYKLPKELIWGEEPSQAPLAVAGSQAPMPAKRALGRRTTDEDPPSQLGDSKAKFAPAPASQTCIHYCPCAHHRADILYGKELISVEKRARIARARAEEEEQNLVAERKRQALLEVQCQNAQLQCRTGPHLKQQDGPSPAPTSGVWLVKQESHVAYQLSPGCS